MKKALLSATIVLLSCTAAPALEQGKYPVKGIHQGGSVTPVQA
jgi:hypothetical protein